MQRGSRDVTSGLFLLPGLLPAETTEEALLDLKAAPLRGVKGSSCNLEMAISHDNWWRVGSLACSSFQLRSSSNTLQGVSQQLTLASYQLNHKLLQGQAWRGLHRMDVKISSESGHR